MKLNTRKAAIDDFLNYLKDTMSSKSYEKINKAYDCYLSKYHDEHLQIPTEEWIETFDESIPTRLKNSLLYYKDTALWEQYDYLHKINEDLFYNIPNAGKRSWFIFSELIKKTIYSHRIRP